MRLLLGKWYARQLVQVNESVDEFGVPLIICDQSLTKPCAWTHKISNWDNTSSILSSLLFIYFCIYIKNSDLNCD